ncbi:MAG: hypothetical protein HND47_18490 [Chloroflexi bacterium]|nr:hypothetical protein [Chloroflexota bacterium]
MIFQLPIPDLKKPPAFKFPERCVSCGKPKEEMLGISLNMGVQIRNKPVTLEMKVPMCKACAEKERGVAKVTLVPFLIAGLIVGAVVFVPVTLLAPEGTSPQTLNTPFVLGGAAGLFAGILGGTMVEAIVKTLAIPFYGRLVTRRPLTVLAMFSEADQLIGISVKFLRDKKLVQLEFENEDIAREFSKLNQLETP